MKKGDKINTWAEMEAALEAGCTIGSSENGRLWRVKNGIPQERRTARWIPDTRPWTEEMFASREIYCVAITKAKNPLKRRKHDAVIKEDILVEVGRHDGPAKRYLHLVRGRNCTSSGSVFWCWDQGKTAKEHGYDTRFTSPWTEARLITPEPPKEGYDADGSILDGWLVWIWNDSTHGRAAYFYDAINSRPFSSLGKRDYHGEWTNFSAIPRAEWPAWAVEAHKTLQL